MKALIARVSRKIPVSVEEIDISGDPDLEARYGVEIPVLMVNGRKAAKYRVTEEQLVAILKGRAQPSTSEQTEDTEEHLR